MDQNGPDVGPNGSEMDEKPFPGLIFPGHISEQKWNRNAVRWTSDGPKRIMWFQTDHMVPNRPDGLDMDEDLSADFIFPEHIFEYKWDRNAVR